MTIVAKLTENLASICYFQRDNRTGFGTYSHKGYYENHQQAKNDKQKFGSDRRHDTTSFGKEREKSVTSRSS